MTIKITAQDIIDAMAAMGPEHDEMDLGRYVHGDDRKTAVRRVITIGNKTIFFVPEAVALRFVFVDARFPMEKIGVQNEERAAEVFNDGL